MASALSLDDFFRKVRLGEEVDYLVLSGESLDYPHVFLNYAAGVIEIVAMVDGDTEIERFVLPGASADDIDSEAGRLLRLVQSRPFRSWTRAQIADRVAANWRRSAESDALVKKLEAERSAIRGKSIDAMARQMQLTDMKLRATKESIARAKQVQSLNLEIHVRDSPDLVAEFGPGAD